MNRADRMKKYIMLAVFILLAPPGSGTGHGSQDGSTGPPLKSPPPAGHLFKKAKQSPAMPAQDPEGRINSMHPTFKLLDDRGEVIQNGQKEPDQVKTCGQCHATDFIARHSLQGHAPGGVPPRPGCLTCHYEGGKANWSAAALDAEGMVIRDWLRISKPSVSNCGSCHGLTDNWGGPVSIPRDYGLAAYPQGSREQERFQLTRSTGSLYSSQEVAASFLNISGKQDLDFPWDIHARKLLKCTECHYAPKDPQRSNIQTESTAGLRVEPRRETLSEYLKQPDHRLATANCRSCHDPKKGHGFLPYPERHFQAVACESCHIPRQYGPAEQTVDAILLDESGSPLVEYRGIPGEAANLNTVYSHGFAPALLTAERASPAGAGHAQACGLRSGTQSGDLSEHPGSDVSPPALGPIAPVNLVSRWYWASGGNREPVPREAVQQALMINGHYRPELIAALDSNHDGNLSRNELKLDTDSKRKTVEQLLIAAGVRNPVIRSEVSVYKINHGVAPKSLALSDCSVCHSAGSKLGASVVLASMPPGSDLPVWSGEATVPGQIVMEPGGKVILKPASLESQKLHVFGTTSNDRVDRLGLFMLVGVVFGVALHAGCRVVSRRAAGRSSIRAPARSLGAAAAPPRVYLFTAYERIWHWVMALSVLALILTGIQIHFPGRFYLFGAASAVATHNFFAAVLMLNAFLALFYHLATAAIRQFLPNRKGMSQEIARQTRYYLRDIFRGLPAPFHPSPERKLNVLQQFSYLFLLNVLFPFQMVTGVMIWLVGKSPGFANTVGGLYVIAQLHNLGSWMFMSFLIAHVYLATTGHTVLGHLRGMVDGYEVVGPRAEMGQ